MTRATLLNSLTRNVAVALATLAFTLVAACFASTGGEEPEHTPVITPMAESAAEPLITVESLLAELRGRGMEFEYEGYARGQPFIEMNGFVHREGVTGKFTWGEESLWVHEFTGPGEALVAATRIDKDGGGYMMPTRTHGQWIGGGGYGIVGPVYYFLRGNIIAGHLGDSEQVPAALEEIMGQPFAGTPFWSGDAGPDERIPGVASLWRDHTVEAEFVSVEKFGGQSDGLNYRIKYRAYCVHSFACSGRFDYDQETDGPEVVGDEIRLTLLQRTVNTDVIEMSQPCDLEWQWDENTNVVRDLSEGHAYKVIINGEQVATFTAG